MFHIYLYYIGGTAFDYADHIEATIQHLAKVYCVINTHEIYVFRKMCDNIRNIMTDRAPVNHATVNELNYRWGNKIHVLYCHLHHLETISRNVLSSLKKFGTSLADKVILGLDKMRYNDGCGDPKGFKAYLIRKEIPQNAIVRCRGNRLHVKLRNAESCVKYKHEILEYLKENCLRNTTFKKTIVDALETEITQNHLRALVIFSNILSKPWMKTLYLEENNKLTHWEAFNIVKLELFSASVKNNLSIENISLKCFF